MTQPRSGNSSRSSRQHPQHRLDQVVLLHVEGHGGAGRRGPPRRSGRCSPVAVFSPCSLSPSPTAVGLTETSAAPRPGVPALGQPAEQADVLVRGGRRLVRVGGVLTEVVEGDEQTAAEQLPGHRAARRPGWHPPRTWRPRPWRSGRWSRSSRYWSLAETASIMRRSTAGDLPGRTAAAVDGQPGPDRSGYPAGRNIPAPAWRSATLTFAPASGETMTSCAASTPPASSCPPAGTVRFTSASAIGPSS